VTGAATGQKPLVTVVTVVRNGAAQLETTLESVFALGYPRLDYIVIDGGSTDGTLEVIRRYAERLTYWVSEPDRGIYDAMNKGWAAAQPEGYLLFLGAGDRLLSLPAELELLEHGQVIYGAVELAGRKFRPQAGWPLRCNNTLHHQALLVPKSLHPEPPFDLRFPTYADFDFNQRLLKQGVSFRFSPGLRGFAMPDGVSARKPHLEMLAIVAKNFGIAWCAWSLLYLVWAKLVRQLRDRQDRREERA
jgi:glycosyltransferase involved in cell wall biosynthesis